MKKTVILLAGILLLVTACSMDKNMEYWPHYKWRVRYWTFQDSYRGRFNMRLNAFYKALETKPEIRDAFQNGNYDEARRLMEIGRAHV